VGQNPYAPPTARVEDAPKPRAVAGRYWVRFYLSPLGRTGRLFYWLFGFLPLTVLGLGLGFFLPRTLGGARYLLVATILLIWPQAVVLARRLHDINVTGWLVALFWALPLALVLLHVPVPSGSGTLVGWLGSVVLGLIPGTRGPNRYGNDPSGNSSVPPPQTS